MSYTKLLKLISDNGYNIASAVDEDQHAIIVRQCIAGYKADCDSRAEWLENNERATELMNNSDAASGRRNFPFKNPCDIIVPLLAPAAISFASRLTPHIKQNGTAAKHVVFGADPQGILQQKADRRSKYLNYRLLHESSTWTLETHKLLMIVGTWGIAFRKIYRDQVDRKNCIDLLHPRDVIINHQIQSLEKCGRYTIRNYYSKNDLVSRIHADVFLDIDLDKLSANDNEYRENESTDEFPVYEILEQYCLLDLDEDGYYEPYIAVFHETSETLLGIFPAYEIEDIHIHSTSDKIIKIDKHPGIVPYFGIDNPDGGFYSIGLNSLLYNLNKGANTLLRQLVDSGTLSNQAAGFITRAVRPQERALKFELGEYKVIDAPPNIDLRQHIMPLPFNEPSQVLFKLLGLIIQTGKEVGMITEILTGETTGQNVPATTMLALIEQGTRAFKPVVEKLFLSLKTEFEIISDLIAKYDDPEEYKIFHGLGDVTGDDQHASLLEYDYGDDKLKIEPVADPTLSSEAHRYAQLQAIAQLLQQGAIPNPAAAVKFYLEGLQIPNPEQFLQTQPPPPDPKLVKVEADKEVNMAKIQIDQQRLELDRERALMQNQLDKMEMMIKTLAAKTNIEESQVDAELKGIEARYAGKEMEIKERLAQAQEDKIELDSRKLDLQERKQRSTIE